MATSNPVFFEYRHLCAPRLLHILVTPCGWTFSSSTGQAQLVRAMLWWIGGFAAVSVPALFYLWGEISGGVRPSVWVLFIPEVLVAAGLALIYARYPDKISLWRVAPFLMLHYGLWSWEIRPHYALRPSSFVTIVALIACVAWLFYLHSLWEFQRRNKLYEA